MVILLFLKKNHQKKSSKQTTKFLIEPLEMMNRWLEKEYQVAAQLLKESRDGKDSQNKPLI